MSSFLQSNDLPSILPAGLSSGRLTKLCVTQEVEHIINLAAWAVV
jgi:hypothetical protein